MSRSKKTFDHFPLNGTFHQNLERETKRRRTVERKKERKKRFKTF
jgi:hypothetical protein